MLRGVPGGAGGGRMDTVTMARKLAEWRDAAMVWRKRAIEAEAALERVRRLAELNRGNRTPAYAGTSNYVPIADLEDALGEHVEPSRGPHEVPARTREVPTSDLPTVKWCGWCDVAGHTTDECPTPGRTA